MHLIGASVPLRSLLCVSAGRRREYIKLSFRAVSDQMAVRSDLKPIIERNQRRLKREGLLDSASGSSSRSDPLSVLVDIREYDVPYTTRASIDRDIRVGKWYRVAPLKGAGAASSSFTSASLPSPGSSVSGVDLVRVEAMPPDFVVGVEPRILAWDIETTKAPLKFPNAEVDQVRELSARLQMDSIQTGVQLFLWKQCIYRGCGCYLSIYFHQLFDCESIHFRQRAAMAAFFCYPICYLPLSCRILHLLPLHAYLALLSPFLPSFRFT